MKGWLCLAATLWSLSAEAHEIHDAERFECLRDAYPEAGLALHAEPPAVVVGAALPNTVRLTWDDGLRNKSLADMLAAPDLQDTVAQTYPAGPHLRPPTKDDDPGRVRLDAFLEVLYGDSPRAVEKNLDTVVWMPKHVGQRLRFNRNHGAAEALRRVSAELDQLPAKLRVYVTKTAGTYNWRTIAGTNRRSAHAYGIAIDVGVEHSDYWRWDLKKNPDLPYRNRFPIEVVQAFERHGFVWGGRWHHYDTMHFEYRPELLHRNCVRPLEGESK